MFWDIQNSFFSDIWNNYFGYLKNEQMLIPPAIENRVRGHTKSSKMIPFNPAPMTSY